VTQSNSLLIVSQVRSKEVQHFEDEEPQNFTGPVLLQQSEGLSPAPQQSTDVNTTATASTKGVALTQQLRVANGGARVEGGAPIHEAPVVDNHAFAEGVHADWPAWWHAMVKLGNGTLQAARAFCIERKAPFSMQLALRQVAAQGTLGIWGWIAIAVGFGLTFIVISVSLGGDKYLDCTDPRKETNTWWPPNLDMPRPSAKFTPRASVQKIQGASLLSIRREVCMPSPSPTDSFDARTFLSPGGDKAAALSSVQSLAVPQSDPPAAACLCRELVVPPNCESCLRFPTNVGEGTSMNVTDMNGCEVMRFVFRKQGSQQQILLTSVYGEILAYCGHAPGTHGEFHLLRAHGEYFGKLMQGDSRNEYSILTTSGAELLFTGSGHTVKVTDTWGRLLAMTEPDTEGTATTSSPRGDAAGCCWLRVAPLMDVSIVICGLLIINHLLR